MSARRQTAAHASYTASVIRRMAARNNVTASVSENDLFAHHVTRLSGDDVLLDDVEQMVIAWIRAWQSRRGGKMTMSWSARLMLMQQAEGMQSLKRPASLQAIAPDRPSAIQSALTARLRLMRRAGCSSSS